MSIANTNPRNLSRTSVSDLRQFRYFAALQEYGSISSAAASLGISQPSLSEFIKRLEVDLETKLVVRSLRGVELTEAGALFAEYSLEILDKVQSARDHVRSLGVGSQASVELGMPSVIAGVLAVHLTETVHHEYPGKQFIINECPSGAAIEQVRAGLLDFAISYRDFDLKGDVYAEPLMDEQLFVIAAPDVWEVETDERGVALQSARFDQLRDKALVLTNAASAWRRTVNRMAQSNGIDLTPEFEIESLSGMVSLVRRASAIGIVPQSAAFREAARGELVLIPFADPNVSVRTYTVRAHGRPISQFSLVVEKLLAQVLRENIARYGLHAKILRD